MRDAKTSNRQTTAGNEFLQSTAIIVASHEKTLRQVKVRTTNIIEYPFVNKAMLQLNKRLNTLFSPKIKTKPIRKMI